MTSTSLLPVVLMRGGTSKGVFVRDDDLPAPARTGTACCSG